MSAGVPSMVLERANWEAKRLEAERRALEARLEQALWDFRLAAVFLIFLVVAAALVLPGFFLP